MEGLLSCESDFSWCGVRTNKRGVNLHHRTFVQDASWKVSLGLNFYGTSPDFEDDTPHDDFRHGHTPRDDIEEVTASAQQRQAGNRAGG